MLLFLLFLFSFGWPGRALATGRLRRRMDGFQGHRRGIWASCSGASGKNQSRSWVEGGATGRSQGSYNVYIYIYIYTYVYMLCYIII